MKLKIEINCNNSAFGEDESELREELYRIITQEVALMVYHNKFENQVIRDYNGNSVGSIQFLGKVKQKEGYRDWETDRKSTRLNSSHSAKSRMPSSA